VNTHSNFELHMQCKQDWRRMVPIDQQYLTIFLENYLWFGDFPQQNAESCH